MAASSTATKKFGGPLVVGLELDVKDLASGKWFQAQVIQSEFFKIEIKYANNNSQYNTEWISTEKELDRIEPLGTHTIVKIEETDSQNDTEKSIKSNKNDTNNNIKTNINKVSDEKQDSNVLIDYFEESDSGFVVTHQNSSKSKSKQNNDKNYEKMKAESENKIITSLEAKVNKLESKLQTALRNDAALNNKVNNLTKENEELKLKAARMSKEIKHLKQMINELKTEDLGAWEEIE